jgi:hypothetical protein
LKEDVMQNEPRRRNSLSAAQRREALDRTDSLARQMIDEENRKRDAKTERLRSMRQHLQVPISNKAEKAQYPKGQNNAVEEL